MAVRVSVSVRAAVAVSAGESAAGWLCEWRSDRAAERGGARSGQRTAADTVTVARSVSSQLARRRRGAHLRPDPLRLSAPSAISMQRCSRRIALADTAVRRLAGVTATDWLSAAAGDGQTGRQWSPSAAGRIGWDGRGRGAAAADVHRNSHAASRGCATTRHHPPVHPSSISALLLRLLFSFAEKAPPVAEKAPSTEISLRELLRTRGRVREGWGKKKTNVKQRRRSNARTRA